MLADTQDNPGAGGNGDTTGLLAALLRRQPRDAVLGLLIDPRLRAQAHAIGPGRTAVFRLGETSGVPGHVPLSGEFTVEVLADGRFTCTGPMFHGFKMDLGPMAVLRQGQVESCSRRRSARQPIRRCSGMSASSRAAAHPRAEELGALPRRFRADRKRGAGGRRPRTGECRSDDVRVDAIARRAAPEADGSSVPSATGRRIASAGSTMQRRYVIALIKHETNTFSPLATPLASFGHGNGPAFGDEARERFAGTNTPMAAYLDIARRDGAAIVTPVAAESWPSNKASRQTFEALVQPLEAAVPQVATRCSWTCMARW